MKLQGFTLPLLVLFMVQSAPAVPAVYKWVDENGVTQFTQTPPPKQDVEYVKPPPPPAVDPGKALEDLRTREKAFDNRRAAEAKQREEADKAAQEAVLRKQNCATARSNLQGLLSRTNIRVRGPDGNITRLTAEERDQRIADARKQIEEFCK